MIKRIALALMAFAMIFGISVTVIAANVESELTRDTIIDELNNLNLIGDFDFFLFEEEGLRLNSDEMLHFDTIEEFERYLNELTLALRQDLAFSAHVNLLDPNVTLHMASPNSVYFRQGSASAPIAFATRFVIGFSYAFHPIRTTGAYWLHILNPQPVITDFRINTSALSGLQAGISWQHISGGNPVLTSASNVRTDFRFDVTGVLRQGVGIGGIIIGFDRIETITGGLFAWHPSGNHFPEWPDG